MVKMSDDMLGETQSHMPKDRKVQAIICLLAETAQRGKVDAAKNRQTNNG